MVRDGYYPETCSFLFLFSITCSYPSLRLPFDVWILRRLCCLVSQSFGGLLCRVLLVTIFIIARTFLLLGLYAFLSHVLLHHMAFDLGKVLTAIFR